MTMFKKMTPSICHVTLITILVFFERSYVVPHSCKVSQLEFNWCRIYEGYLMPKRPSQVSIANHFRI